jgi:hypothetical protein
MVTPEGPVVPPVPLNRDWLGPYDAVVNGVDSVGHPLNGSGRCEHANTTAPYTCP